MTDLKRPSNIIGYEHPTNANYSSNSGIYKTFTEGKKIKRKEKFGKTTVIAQYTTYDTRLDKNLCPICNIPSINTCSCVYNDKKCSNAHMWYTDRNGNTKSGNPHQS